MGCVPPQGGGGGRHVETVKETTSGSLLDAREVAVANMLKMSKRSTYSLCLDARKVVVMAEMLKEPK